MDDVGQEEPTTSGFFRHRSPTFSTEEVKSLLNIIEKYKTTLFNKSTTAAACHAKEIAWVKIAKIFNRQGFRHKRSADCLKIKWDNMKKRARMTCKNLMDPTYSECDEMTSHLVAMMCEVENSTSTVEEPVESDGDLNETENHKESTEGPWDVNEDKDSNDSSMDGGKENDSRHRSPTFTTEEVKSLLNIIDKYKTTVFNKSTTAAACHAKEMAWVKIAKIFNRQGFRHKRSANCLKIKWDNMKKRARMMCKNLMDPSYSECDEMTSQMVAMMCEVENSTSAVEEPVESDGDLNETENHKESTEGPWDANEDKDSNDSSMDGGKENDRYINRSMNFSMNECNLLLQCVRQEKNIIFSKTNTSSFNKMKNQAWERISSSYNKLSPQKRSTKVLRTKFTNMRRLVKSSNIKKYFKQFNKKYEKLEDSGSKIKSEPLFECQSSMDADNDSDYGYIEPDNKSNSDINTTLDPLSTVLNSDLGISSIRLENKEVIRLKIELLKYKLETEKLKRKRIEDLIQADAAERETKSRESSLKLRAARLEAIAAEMKLPPAHPALAYTAEETRAQHYIHQYHAT